MSLVPDMMSQQRIVNMRLPPAAPHNTTTYEPELDKKLSDILDEINNYCATPSHLYPDLQEVRDKFRTEWSKVLDFNDKMVSPKYLQHIQINDDFNMVATSRFYSYCSSVRQIVHAAREYFKTPTYAAAKHRKESDERYDRDVLKEATERLEKNFYTGNIQTKDQLEAERFNIVKNPPRYRKFHPEIKDVQFESDVILKMIEMC